MDESQGRLPGKGEARLGPAGCVGGREAGGIASQAGCHAGKGRGADPARLATHREPRRWALLGQDAASLPCSDFRTSQDQWKVPHPLSMYR